MVVCFLISLGHRLDFAQTAVKNWLRWYKILSEYYLRYLYHFFPFFGESGTVKAGKMAQFEPYYYPRYLGHFDTLWSWLPGVETKTFRVVRVLRTG